jgi:hypothetical protein
MLIAVGAKRRWAVLTSISVLASWTPAIVHATFSVAELFLKTPSVSPQMMRKAPSIQVDIAVEDRMFYKVALHNLSTKTVTAFRVDMPEREGCMS